MTPASAYGIVLEYRGAHIIIIITPEYIVSSRLLARVQFTLIHLSIEKLTWRTTGLSTQSTILLYMLRRYPNIFNPMRY